MNSSKSTSSNGRRRPSVALIGCGPSGMFFLHALGTRRRQLQQQGGNCDELPVVTCFEASSSPGGVWRSDRNGNSTSMYEALWTNGPHFAMEFFDHTYDEHCGCALPMYLPRKLVLQYLIERVTKNDANFFNRVKFNTLVQSVKYDDEMAKFVVQTLDKETAITSTSFFDKCIWAGGGNGRPHIPNSIAEALSSFRGNIMHSSQTDENFDQYVRDKCILIIGDNYSAEDLTLQAIKLGVKEVTICSRSGMGMAYYTEAWPGDKVDLVYGCLPTGVTNDGFGIILTKSEYDFERDEYVRKKKKKTLNGIDTVIYCTGYDSNFDMLNASLRPDGKDALFSKDDLPHDWKMSRNGLFNEFGDVPVGTIKECWLTQKNLYRGVLISNPNMMFVKERMDVPLIDLDVQTWLLLMHITRDNLPSIDEMKRFNREQFSREMDVVMLRYQLDMNYKQRWWNVSDNHWTYDHFDERSIQFYKQYYRLQYQILARDMIDSNYPLNIGTYGELNEKGEALVKFNIASSYARYNLDGESPDAEWRTFRDCDPSNCYSIFTGTKAVPLKCHWLDLDCNEYNLEK